MKKILNNILKSFTTDSDGWSARKLSAFVGVVTAIYITIKEIPTEAQLHALYAWLAFVLVCLGIVTIEQIIRLKEGNGSDNIEKNGEPTS